MSKQPDINEMQELDSAIQSIVEKAKTTDTTEGLLQCIVSSAEKILIHKALQIAKGNQIHASTILGISLNTLKSKMKEYQIFSE